MQNRQALIDLTASIATYETAWRTYVAARGDDYDATQRGDAAAAMNTASRAQDDAYARLSAAIGRDLAAPIRAALIAATCSTHGERKEEHRDSSIAEKMIRRPHDYF